MEDKMNLDQLCAECGYRFADRASRIMFNIDRHIEDIISELKEGKLHNQLKKEFENRKISLENLHIEQENEGKWQIKSNEKQFVIEKRDAILSVYKKDAVPSDAKKAEVLITKALGVLQEQGLYAFALFCKSRPSGERAGAEEIEATAKELLKVLKELDFINNFINNGDFLEELRKDNGLLTNLDDLMLAIQMLEKSLIYARFHAKAIKES
ncbi:hypothetical protein DRJ16_01205 [Candidatus Woesearchaeota archaeon]|nr:MAG: hypothetical protein DRJ16_01205 [Candidatus Woesearchaeota archaeon]